VSGRVRWGLRARLVIAFVAVALLGAVVTTVYSSISLTSHLEASARTRLQNSATHFGDVAAVVSSHGGWTNQSIQTLHHLAQIDSLAARLFDARGRPVFTHPPSGPVAPGAAAAAPVMVGGRQIGRVIVSRDDGKLFTAEEVQLRRQLIRTNLVAGATSAAIALAVALYLAVTLSRPLRRIRAGAEAMGAGDLETRVPESGDDEIAAVAEALNSLAETLQQEESLRKESVADLAHELRTPVMGLLARVEAAQDGVLADETANLSAMHDEALRLTYLLDDLSALADAERPGLLLSVEPVDLGALARAQAAAFAGVFAEKGIALSCDAGAVVVDGEPKRLEQIVVNLLSNALRYTDAGGSVSVTVRRQGDDALLEVADTGIGIPSADLPRVFTRFWRGEKSRSRATGGAGIGLAIVHELVRAHGGRVTVESEVGAGSVFRVTIPASGPRPSPTEV
jgi:two-component system, OmpR family, sensor histidine kinase BaeS